MSFSYFVGVNFTSLTQMLPFVMFGIGLDDSFIIHGAYLRTDPQRPVLDRIRATFHDIGLSIFLTKMTTSTAFGLGCTSNIPTLYWLSCYAMATVLVDFLYQITFFVALIVLDQRRIDANRRDCFLCVVDFGCEDDEDSDVQTEALSNSSGDEEDNQSEATSSPHGKGWNKRNKPDDETNNVFVRFMNAYGNFILRPTVKVLVLIGFAAMAAGLAYSTSLFRSEFNMTDMLPRDSFARQYLMAADSYGQRAIVVPAVYFRNVDQSNTTIQQQMEDYVNDMVGIDAISAQPPLFWLRHFKEFLTYDDRLLDLTFNQQLDIFLSIDAFQSMYGPHIARDEESGEIISSRCVLYMDQIDLNSVGNQLETNTQQRSVSESQPVNQGLDTLNFFLWEPTIFTWDFYATIEQELITTTILGVTTVSLIGFAIIPHWSSIFYLFFLISILYVELMGKNRCVCPVSTSYVFIVFLHIR